MHQSVGAIIENKQSEILMIERMKFPFGWAGPAGHIEEGEIPEEALLREVKEETGLKIDKYKLLQHKFIDWNECSRGERGHDWFLFKVINYTGEIKKEKSEVKDIKWVKTSKLENLNLEKVWRMWLKKLKII